MHEHSAGTAGSRPDDTLLTTRQVAAQFRINPDTLQRWRSYGGGPKFVKLSARAIRYRRSDVVTFLNGLSST